MPNIAAVLKSEIARVARKELRGEIQRLKQATTQQRAHIAALKRQMLTLEQHVKRLSKKDIRSAARVENGEPGTKTRFSAKSLAAQRKRLGLSANALATLLGVSALSVYKWEGGKVRPSAAKLPSIASLRTMGKKDAAVLLEALAK